MRNADPTARDRTSLSRTMERSPPWLETNAIYLQTVLPRDARAVVGTCQTAVVTMEAREREADSLLEGVIGSIIIIMVLGGSAIEILIGGEDLIGDGAKDHLGELVHVMSEGLSKGILTRCDIFLLARCVIFIFVFSLATSVAASARPCKSDVFRREADKTMVKPREVRDLRALDVEANYLPLPLPLEKFVGMLNEASASRVNRAQLGADRLYIWRSARTTAVGSYLRSCVEGRAYGPKMRLLPRRWSRARAASGGDTSGPGSPRVAARRCGSHTWMEDCGESASQSPPFTAASPFLATVTKFEGATRLGRRAVRTRHAAATLPPAPATARRILLGPARRPPPATPLPALPGIPSTLVSSSRALSVGK